MSLDPATSGFVPLHLFMDPDGGYTDRKLAWACVEWAGELANFGYAQ